MSKAVIKNNKLIISSKDGKRDITVVRNPDGGCKISVLLKGSYSDGYELEEEVTKKLKEFI